MNILKLKRKKINLNIKNLKNHLKIIITLYFIAKTYSLLIKIILKIQFLLDILSSSLPTEFFFKYSKS